ncbi:esterase E4-like [Pectinophora gossypiella]|uniref:esterase E4-like n=1 Tax=Pectinophora gossypiella TaxID=13191 RepID=UPI00214EDD9E|nr:esterase E4-like [Pectinophora gossypiella]
MYRGTVVLVLSLLLRIQCHKVEVKVKQGKLVGIRAATVFDRRLHYAFYGVPYAEIPIGHLRFKNPKSAKKWDRPYDASTPFHGACAQAHITHRHALYGVEDCLYLNIYTPSLPKDGVSSLKPTIVWIHGYAFTSSFSHIHGGDFLVDNDVIFISLTHRLNAFGFLKINETDSNANMGLKDIVMALKWIKKNIKQFDGDEKKITVMGSDSAGTYLTLLLLSKSNKLFSKMILQSGSLFSPSIFQSDHNKEREKLKQEVKISFSKDLVTASSKDIITASSKIYTKKDWINFQKPVVPFSPIIELKSNKSLISVSPYTQSLEIKIPLMIGFNSQESISEIIPFLRHPHILNTLNSFFKFMVPFPSACHYNYTSKTYVEIADKIKKKYFNGHISEASIQDFMRYASDLRKYPVYKFIKTLTGRFNNEIYVYKFNYVGKFNAMKASSTPDIVVKAKGAANGDEVCYLTKCEPLWEGYVQVRDTDNDRDKHFIKEMAEVWANFARTGKPTPRPYFANVTWLPMTSKNDNVLLISRTSKLIDSKVEEKMFSFWNRIYDDYYAPERCKGNKRDEL